MEIIAKFECLKCGHKYQHKPSPSQCPKCGNLYVKWVNYEELREYWRKEIWKSPDY